MKKAFISKLALLITTCVAVFMATQVVMADLDANEYEKGQLFDFQFNLSIGNNPRMLYTPGDDAISADEAFSTGIIKTLRFHPELKEFITSQNHHEINHLQFRMQYINPAFEVGGMPNSSVRTTFPSHSNRVWLGLFSGVHYNPADVQQGISMENWLVAFSINALTGELIGFETLSSFGFGDGAFFSFDPDKAGAMNFFQACGERIEELLGYAIYRARRDGFISSDTIRVADKNLQTFLSGFYYGDEFGIERMQITLSGLELDENVRIILRTYDGAVAEIVNLNYSTFVHGGIRNPMLMDIKDTQIFIPNAIE